MNKVTDTPYVINMTVLNDSEFLSPYSATDAPVISSDVAEFLENGAAKHLPKRQIELNVLSDCIDDNEKPVYDSAIRNYFRLKADGSDTELKRNLIVSVVFTVIGVIALAAMLLLDHFFASAIWTEVVDIFAWVFVWEAVDQFFIERRRLLRDRRKYQAFTQARISFQSLSKAEQRR